MKTTLPRCGPHTCGWNAFIGNNSVEFDLPMAALFIAFLAGCSSSYVPDEAWRIDTTEEWRESVELSDGIQYVDGTARPKDRSGGLRSVMYPLPSGKKLNRLTVTQSPVWQNWTETGKVEPSNLRDAPVFLALGPRNYWIFGRYHQGEEWKGFTSEAASIPGFDVPLTTTPLPNQFDAPGGRKKGLGGYHAWQSRDMIHWVHHGPVTDQRSRWVTSAEFVDGKAYIYFDFPNDQDPHLIVDSDLTDGELGQDMGMAFRDPSDGSDSAVIRDLEGNFHLVYEDWSPINARTHSWDSPLAGHAVSPDGKQDFQILNPVVDERTNPTGTFDEFPHPHWHREDPKNYPGRAGQNGTTLAYSRYEVHEPEQNAFGDWAAIAIGGQYYLFSDFHPAGTTLREDMKIAWFTSPSLGTPFEFCDSIGQGHPDPDIGFAEGQFYLINQTEHTYISPGPWTGKVAARVGVDTTHDGLPDVWTDWQTIQEVYDYVQGFAKQLTRRPASLDLGDLPPGSSFCFELQLEDTTENASMPVVDRVSVEFMDL